MADKILLEAGTGGLLLEDGSGVLLLEAPSASGVTAVTATVTDTTLLAAFASRASASIYNDSTATLYLLCASGTSSSTNLTAKLLPGNLYVVPYGYTGVVKGVWTSADGGAARITET